MGSTVAVIGLGIMGSRLAGRLLGAGYTVRGFDPDPVQLDAFERAGGVPTGSPAEAATHCGAVVLSLLTSDISRDVCLGEGGIATTPSRPLLVLDSTTGRPDDSISIGRQLAAVGIEYADMTISGNAAVAERGELVVMVGGSSEAYRQAEPIMGAIGRSHHHVGPLGAGARAKLIVNHALTINRAAIAEALVAAELAGLDLVRTLEILRDSVAYSRAMDLWGERMVTADHARPNARLRQSHKDARLIVEHAQSVGAPHDFIELVREALAEGEDTGLGELDNSSIIEVVRRRAGIGRVPQAKIEIGHDEGTEQA